MSKYPNRGGDCEHTMDCPWGVDGWCDRPSGSKCEIQKMDEAKVSACEKACNDSCSNFCYLGEGSAMCDKAAELKLVLDEWDPTDNYLWCKKDEAQNAHLSH